MSTPDGSCRVSVSASTPPQAGRFQDEGAGGEHAKAARFSFFDFRFSAWPRHRLSTHHSALGTEHSALTTIHSPLFTTHYSLFTTHRLARFPPFASACLRCSL